MLRDELTTRHPTLFHMATAGSWPAIAEFGLLTTEQIVTTSGLSPREQTELLGARRATSALIDHPRLGPVTIRDQAPLNLAHLRLDDQSLSEWLHELNSRVFFWLHPLKLATLLNARRYRNLEQDVLEVDSASLLDAVGERAMLSPVNSGATLYPSAPVRGSKTFSSIDDYDYRERRRARGAVDAIVELAVSGGVADIRDHVVAVRRMRANTVIEEIPL